MSIIKRITAIALMLCTVAAFCACTGEQASNISGDSSVSVEESSSAPAESSAAVEESSNIEASVSEETTEETALVNYTVTVVDSEGNPVVGALVQLCNDSTCFLPVASDAEGKVVFAKEVGEYKACIAGATDYVEFNGGTEITITYDAPKA